ncbi:hypothetical protein [Oleidesulfovibrio sp.]|uniref:hypothetical protein n=1 Tax=Oleidesulfovibrio sp. TaxID=2909707 RepID=UPI003A86C2F8
MFWWQWSVLVVAAVLAAIGFLCPPRGTVGQVLRIILAWFLPYALITVAFCTGYIQSMWMAVPYLAAAYFLYISFVRKHFG